MLRSNSDTLYAVRVNIRMDITTKEIMQLEDAGREKK